MFLKVPFCAKSFLFYSIPCQLETLVKRHPPSLPLCRPGTLTVALTEGKDLEKFLLKYSLQGKTIKFIPHLISSLLDLIKAFFLSVNTQVPQLLSADS